MRIGVDGRGLRGGRGIARVTGGTLRALADAHPEDVIAVAAPARRRLTFAAAALTGRPRLEDLAGGADVVWLPAPAPVAVGRGVPLVLTVHDLSFDERPQDFTAYERLWHRLARPPRLIARADVVLCDSHATRSALLARWPHVAPDRCRVVPPGFDRPAAPAAHWDALPGRFLLAVGALEPRKGIDVLLDAFTRARARGLDAELVLAGDGRLRDRAAATTGVRVLGGVHDTRLASLYAQALALAMPSRLEGFGLPPLEAAAHGTPAVVSELPVFRETLGDDGALRVPVDDPDALAAALLRIADDGALRERLAADARAASAPLTWEAAAAGLHAALCEAAAR